MKMQIITRLLPGLLMGLSANGILLLGGRFETTTDVTGFLNLALDAAEIQASNDVTEKTDIYKRGRNAYLVDIKGQKIHISLASLSQNSTDEMIQDPMFNIFRRYFESLGGSNGEEEGLFSGHPVQHYADAVVGDLFDINALDIELEAALTISLWMAAVHELYEVMRACESQNRETGLGAIDRVAALWIGALQQEGSNEQGHLLYKLAEIAGQRFGQDQGETVVNTRVIEILKSLQENISSGMICGQESGNSVVRDDVQNLIGLMTVPLIQNLIHHTINAENESGPDYVELYGLSVFPRLEACDPNVHDSDLNFYSLKSLDISQRLQSITKLQAFLGCLRVSCADVGSYLEGVVPQCEDNAAGITSASLSYIDRDVLQMEIFLKYQAYGAALDIYRFGYNSIYSLQALALNTIIPGSPASQFDIFRDYYETPAFDFADTKIVSALRLEAPFKDASPEQISEFILGLLNSEVLYLSIVSSVQFAIQECWKQNTSSALQYLDMSSAFYIGSIEGGSRGGQDRGQLLFAVSKQLCSKFGTCVGEGSDTNSMMNEVIVDAFLTSMNAVANQDCQVAEDSIKTTIIPALQITLIQGMLVPASVNKAQPSILRDRKLAMSYAFSQGLLPLVHASDEESAELIEQNIRSQFNETALVDGFLVAIDALRSALPGMHIKCLDIGTLNMEPSISLCPSTVGDTTSPPDFTTPGQDPLPSVPTQPEANQLAFGRYIFASDTIGESDSSFALDVRDMARAGTVNDARRIYDDGLNAVSSMFSDDWATVSLASFSTDAAIYMSQDPMFSIFKFALYDDKTFDNPNENGFVYADEVVREALNTGDTELAAEAAVVLNVWMMIAHKLYKAVRRCEQGQNAQFEIDSAVALWIGKEQAEGRYDSGWMLYSVGQTGAMHFGHDEGEAAVNSKLILQFNEMQRVAGTCSEDPVAHLELRLLLSAVLRSLSIPLVQHLLFRIAVDYRWHVELYAIAVISQCSACHLPAYMALSDTLYAGFQKDQISDDVLDNLAIFFQCLRISCDDLDSTDNAHADLQTLVGEICQRLNENGDHSKIVHYASSTDVQEQLRIDLDVLQISIFARTKAYQAALEIYTYGQNSVKSLSEQNGNVVYSLLSLQSLSKLPTRSHESEFGLFSKYFGSESYAHDIIMDALRIQDGPSKDASRGQVAELVSSTLQTMVSYMAVLSKFQSAINLCKVANQADAEAEAEWDEGVAFFVGSIEANTPPRSNGVLMYSLGLEQCRHFGTCNESGEATSNVELFKRFGDGISMIKERECGQAESLLSLNITKLMQIPLVQGTLYHAIESSLLDERRAEDNIATGYVLAHSIEPVVNAANATSARIIADNFKFPVEGHAPLPNRQESVFEGFKYAVSKMGIDCNDVGHTLISRELLSVCENGASNGELNNLGEGIYIATTFVQDTASIARDLAEVERALSSGQPNLAKLIYSEGKNSQIFDEDGKFLKLRSLRGLSTDATLEMLDEPLFNIFLYAQQSESNIASTKDSPLILNDPDGSRVFADNFVQKAFQATSKSSRSLAAEASVALNVWMYLSHMLHMTLESCRDGAFLGKDGVHAIDESAALWIGNDQIAGDDQGYLLYALAEEMGERFSIDKTGQAKANTIMLKLLNEARGELSAQNACSDTSSTYTRLHDIVNDIMSQMIIPLVQGLIHNIQVNDKDRVELYALAFVPLVAGCSPETFDFLNENLVSTKYIIGSDAIIKRIRSTFQCLGIKCEDVGFHYSEEMPGGSKRPTCMDSAAKQSLAGYRPAHDVLQYTLLDLDILEIDILMRMNAYKAAERVYLYGKHARSKDNGRGQTLSIARLAAESQTLPGRYYQSEMHGDTIIREALTGSSNQTVVPSQRRSLVIRSCQVMVMYFSALQSLIDSLSYCSATAASDVTASLDKAAAFLIGYLEGSEDGGSGYGHLHYDLAQEYCQEFGTCTVNGTAAVNEQWISLLYSARGAAMGRSCDALRKETKHLESALVVPVIQATISAAARLSAPGYTDQDEAEAFIFSRALLPLLEKVDSSASKSMGAALDLNGRPASRMIGREVINILAGVYDALGIDCRLIGKTGTYDACQAHDSTSSAGSHKYTFLWVTIGAFASLSMFLVFRYRYLKKENSTKIAPDGEINYTTKGLLSRDKFQDTRENVLAGVESLITSTSSSMCVHPGDVESSGIGPSKPRHDLSARYVSSRVFLAAAMVDRSLPHGGDYDLSTHQSIVSPIT